MEEGKVIQISEADYKEAVHKAIDEQMKDEKLEGMAKLFIPLVGSLFANIVAKYLFNKEEN